MRTNNGVLVDREKKRLLNQRKMLMNQIASHLVSIEGSRHKVKDAKRK